MSPEGKNWPAHYALLTAVVLLLYGNTLAGGFVWDDNLFTANQVYWGFDFRTIFFSLANGLEYQPVRDLTYLFDIAVWQGSPLGFHLTNLLLFLAIVLLAYRSAERLAAFCLLPDNAAPTRLVPLFAALIFAVHPLKSEVVAWVTQRNTLLAGFFFFLALLSFLRFLEKEEPRVYVVSLAAFALAILSKATVVTLPLLLVLLLFCGDRDRMGRQGRYWLVPAPFFILAGAGAVLHIIIARQTTVVSAAYFGQFSERLAVALQLPFFYLRKSLLPTGLSAFYAENFAQSLSSLRVLLAALFLLMTAAAAWLLRRKYPEIMIGAGWFFITLLPVSNLLATSPVVADRYLFCPSFGLAFTAAVLLSRIRLPLQAVPAGILLLLCLYGLLTVRQNRLWHDEITLWRQTSRSSPQVAGVWFNYARALHRTPQLALALEAYLRALKLDPRDQRAFDNAAALFPSSRGPIPARYELVRSLLEQMPDGAAGLSLIGHTNAPWQHADAAEELFLYLQSADRHSVVLSLALANLYRKQGAADRAAVIYNEVAQRGDGGGAAEFGLAAIAAASGNLPEMTRLLATAREKGGVPEALLDIASKRR